MSPFLGSDLFSIVVDVLWLVCGSSENILSQKVPAVRTIHFGLVWTHKKRVRGLYVLYDHVLMCAVVGERRTLFFFGSECGV